MINLGVKNDKFKCQKSFIRCQKNYIFKYQEVLNLDVKIGQFRCQKMINLGVTK